MSEAIPNPCPDSANLHRFADPATAALYPLPCQTKPLAFELATIADASKAWQLDIELPPLPADSVVIPSYTQLGGDNYRTQFTLVGETGNSSLPPVPSQIQQPRTSTAVTNTPLAGVSTHIDYWLVTKQTPGLTLRLTLTNASPHSRYLLNLCIRPQQLQGALEFPELNTDQLLGQELPIRPLSQRLGPNAIRGGICSPTATLMAITQTTDNTNFSWPNFVAACRDGATGMYGVWPLNLYQASRLGHLGAVETLTQGDQVNRVLKAGLPLVASIKYATGALLNAPQPQTSGHLVMLHGIAQGKALVSDPAAPSTNEVAREYPLDQFLEAWLRDRGACYLLLPKA